MEPIRRNRTWIWVVALVVLSAVGYGWYWQRNRLKANKNEYRTAPVARGDLRQMVTATGQLAPLTNVTVGSQISGQIKEVLVDYNQHVTNGQVMARIDPSTYQRALQQAEADLANAKAADHLARINNDRSQALVKKHLIAQSDADQAQATLEQADAAVKMKEAAVQNAQVNLDRTTIYSPVDGTVISRDVDAGQTVAASFNTPSLFQVVTDLRKMEIDALVSEADVGGVHDGEHVLFTVDAFPNREFTGRVRQVRYSPTTNQNVITYTTVVDVRNDDLKLRPGMTATVSIITADHPDALRIPNSALIFQPPAGAIVETNAPSGHGGAPAINVAGIAGGSGQTGAAERRRGPGSFRRGQFGGRRFGGGAGRRGGEGGSGNGKLDNVHTVYVLASKGDPDKGEAPVLRAVRIKTGITDNVYTEVLSGLKEGEQVVIGVKLPETTSSFGSSPFRPFGRRRR